MNRWLRQHRYALRVALRRLLAHPFSSLSNVLVIALTLAVPVVGASILVSAEPVVRQISVAPEVTLFMAGSATADDNEKLANRIRLEHAGDIQAVRLVPRDQALNTLKSNPTWADALSVLHTNPLPDAIVVTLAEGPDVALHAGALADQWRGLQHVDSVQLDSDWVKRLEALLRFARIGLGLLGIGVALVVLATIFNTVRMQALTQREEIAVARLVGATEAFVRRPFLYLGALTGIVSSACAIGLALMALYPLNTGLARLASSYGAHIALRLPDTLSLLLASVFVAILAALSARWSVTRNTRF